MLQADYDSNSAMWLHRYVAQYSPVKFNQDSMLLIRQFLIAINKPQAMQHYASVCTANE